MYLLRKWYFDLLTAEGMYLFLYFAYVRLAGVTSRSLVLHVAPGNQEGTFTESVPVKSHREPGGGARELAVGLKRGTIMVEGRGCRIALGTSRASLDLSYSLVVPGGGRPVLIEGARKGRILWKPIGIRYRVEGTVTVDGSRFMLDGCAGYADFLESTILPPWVPVRHLLWGRAHCPEEDLAFVHASGLAGAPSWSRFLLHRKGKVQESDQVEITGESGIPSAPSAGGTGGYTVRAGFPGEVYEMTVHHCRTVQNASFIDQQRFRWSIARSLAKRITRDPHGSKFLSSIEIPGRGTGGRELCMIDEEAYL